MYGESWAAACVQRLRRGALGGVEHEAVSIVKSSSGKEIYSLRHMPSAIKFQCSSDARKDLRHLGAYLLAI
jgi:hypothetical protein